MPRSLPDGIRLLQVNAAMDDRMWRRLGELTRDHGDRALFFRVYGGVTDLEFLKHFTHIRRFAADCIWDLDSIEGLRYLSDDVDVLHLATGKKRLSIEPVLRFDELRELDLERPFSGIEGIDKFSKLEVLRIRSISLPTLDFLESFPRLRGFELRLGGTKDVSGLSHCDNLEYLEMWMINGLENVDEIASLSSVRQIQLQSLTKVKRLPNFSGLTSLEVLHLENLHLLESLASVAKAPALRCLYLYGMKQITPNDLRPFVGHATLEAAHIGLGSMKRSNEAEAVLGLPHPTQEHWLRRISVVDWQH